MVNHDDERRPPSLSPTDRDTLEAFGRKVGSHVIVAPRTGMTEPIVLTAWTKRLGLQAVDEAAIGAFYDQHAQRGPELGVACPSTRPPEPSEDWITLNTGNP